MVLGKKEFLCVDGGSWLVQSKLTCGASVVGSQDVNRVHID